MDFLLKPPDICRKLGAGSWEPQGGSQLRSPARIACCCELISQPFLSACEISQTSFSPAKWSLVLPDICDRHFEIFFFRFLCLNFHFLLVFNHSCNSLARKYPRKGKLPSYINSLVNTKKRTLRDKCNQSIDRYIIYRINEQSTCSVFHIYSCFLVSFLSSQPNSEDFSSEDERLSFLSLGVRKAG